MQLWIRCCFIVGVVFFFIGCNTTPQYNDPITSYVPDAGYRFKNIDPGDNSDSLFVILTFSGGGTRASALSLGVLEKLASIEIEWEGRQVRLLDEVDLISSVSGGSFTAAYYGLFGDDVFETFASGLYQKNQSAILKSAFSIPNMAKQASPFYSRTNTTANRYSDNLFQGKTYGDLMSRNKRPFIILNATDMGIGKQFSFTQDYFDLLYSDISTYPVGFAVAASSAFPGAFSVLVLKNYDQGEEFQLNPFYMSTPKTQDYEIPVHFNFERSASYLKPEKKYLHLSDGGVSDNLGLLPIIRNLATVNHPMGLVPSIPNEKEQKVIIITVNAAAVDEDTVSLSTKTPGLFQLLETAGTTPMESFTNAQVNYLHLLLKYLENKGTKDTLDSDLASSSGTEQAPRDFYFVEIGFESIPDDEKRTFFEEIPTKFTLPEESINRLREVGGLILENNSIFQEFLTDIEVK